MTLDIISTTLDPVSIDRTILDGVVYGNAATSASPFFTEYIVPTYTLEDAPHNYDVLFVPGGGGTRNITGTQIHVDWLRDRLENEDPKYLWTVCTGASIAARTGKLAGRNATTNKAAFTWVKTVDGAEDVNWIEKARWVVDGNYWTSSGVSAGTDMMLGWIEHEYGRNESERIRIGMEWNALNQTDDPFAAEYGLGGSGARKIFSESLI